MKTLNTAVKTNIRSIVMTAAHAVAKEMVGESYAQCLSRALKEVWAAVKDGNIQGTVVPTVEKAISSARVTVATKTINRVVSEVRHTENTFSVLREKHGCRFSHLFGNQVERLLSGTFTHPSQRVVDCHVRLGNKLIHALNTGLPVYKKISRNVVTYYFPA